MLGPSPRRAHNAEGASPDAVPRLPTGCSACRIMQLAEECFGGSRMQAPDLRALVSARIQQAVALRAALGLHCGQTAQATQQAQQAQQTTVFRLLNSEGDRLSGLIVDVLGDHLVVSSSGELLSSFGSANAVLVVGLAAAGSLRTVSDHGSAIAATLLPPDSPRRSVPASRSGLGGAAAGVRLRSAAAAHRLDQHCVAAIGGNAERGGLRTSRAARGSGSSDHG